MIDVIVSLVAHIIIVIMSVIIYVLLVSGLYPRLVVKWEPSRKLRDRGLEKYIFPNGRSVIFEPEMKMRKYIKQYALLSQDGRKYIKCFVNDKIRYLKYDVLVFNNADELVDVVTVSEKLSGKEYSKAAPLPDSTSYVSVVLRVADKMYSDGESVTRCSKKSMIMLVGLVMITSIVESLVLQKCADVIWDCFYKPQNFVDGRNIFMKALIAGVICSALIVLSYCMRAKKVMKK